MRFARLAAAILGCLRLEAQYALPSPPDVLLVGEFHTPLAYDAALAKLGAYYDEQVGRKLPVALPKLGPGVHYETWHDMWVYFDADGSGTRVTLKRPTDAATVILAKGWMLQIAGRVSGSLPVNYRELPPLRSATVDFYGSRKDAAQSLQGKDALRLISTWQHAGLMVSPDSLTRVTLAPASFHGVHKLTATAENLAAAKQMAARLAAASRPCICAVYSEANEVNQTLRKAAQEKADDVNATTAQKVYLAQLDPKLIEDQMREDPATQKRLAAAAGWYAIRYRVDKPYAKVNIRWAELSGYNRDDASFAAERPLGSGAASNVRAAAQPGSLITGRVKLDSLQPGAYRVTIEGETASGEKIAIDQRDYWFDGKGFEEL